VLQPRPTTQAEAAAAKVEAVVAENHQAVEGEAMSYPESIPKPGFHQREITNEAASLLPHIPLRLPFVGVEVGVYLAKTSSILLYHRPRLFLHLVDSWEVLPETKGISERHLRAAGVWDRCEFHHGDATEMAVEVEDGSCDFVFIDASKHPDKYRSDIYAWLPKIRPGGFIQGHDWHHPNVPLIVEAFAKDIGRPFTSNEKRQSWMVQL
jgi:hypothetical protein